MSLDAVVVVVQHHPQRAAPPRRVARSSGVEMPQSSRNPVTIPSCELESCFTASSQRVMKAMFLAQINEANAHGIGSCLWVNQMRAAVERLEMALEDRGLRSPLDLPLDYDDDDPRRS